MTELVTKASNPVDYVTERYDGAVGYYWRAARRNKMAYQWFRFLTIIFSSVVSLAAALSSTEAFGATGGLVVALKVTTPVIATMLTILTGFSQTFQWGATWRESVMTASRLERERDRIRVTPPENRDAQADLKVLNRLILHESDGFFDRLLGRSSTEGTKEPPEETPEPTEADEAAKVPA